MASFKKEYQIKTSAQNLFVALTDEVIIERWSGAPAIMDAKAGTEFALWGESIVGINQLVTDQKLVQLWKESKWKNYSLVTVAWQEAEGNTLVTLTQEDIPEESYKNIVRGWDEHYMNPLTTWLESNNL